MTIDKISLVAMSSIIAGFLVGFSTLVIPMCTGDVPSKTKTIYAKCAPTDLYAKAKGTFKQVYDCSGINLRGIK